MSDEPYTKREQDEWRKDFKEQLDRIEHQTTTTNGRVRKLENWRWFLSGSIALLAWMVAQNLISIANLVK